MRSGRGVVLFGPTCVVACALYSRRRGRCVTCGNCGKAAAGSRGCDRCLARCDLRPFRVLRTSRSDRDRVRSLLACVSASLSVVRRVVCFVVSSLLTCSPCCLSAPQGLNLDCAGFESAASACWARRGWSLRGSVKWWCAGLGRCGSPVWQGSWPSFASKSLALTL